MKLKEGKYIINSKNLKEAGFRKRTSEESCRRCKLRKIVGDPDSDNCYHFCTKLDSALMRICRPLISFASIIRIRIRLWLQNRQRKCQSVRLLHPPEWNIIPFSALAGYF